MFRSHELFIHNQHLVVQFQPDLRDFDLLNFGVPLHSYAFSFEEFGFGQLLIKARA